MDTRSLSEVPLSQRNDFLADMGELLANDKLTEEQAAIIVFGPDPLYSWMAEQDGQMAQARQLI